MRKLLIILGLFSLTGLRSVFAQTVTDVDGNVYDTISIGTQVWMKQNLKTTKYCDGSSIPNINNIATWQTLTTGARCYNNNDSTSYAPVYGAFYNWYAVINTHKICPIGWHVPSNSEWTELTDYLGGESVAGGKMKEAGLSHWANPNAGADNSSGFTALSGTYRLSNGIFENHISYYGGWWSASENDATNAFCRTLNYLVSIVNSGYNPKGYGYRVRCVWDFVTDVKSINKIEQIKVYPNPTTDNLTIETNSNAIIEIINSQGQLIKTLNTSTSQAIIDISNLLVGVYTIRIKTDKGIIVKKLIKQ